MSGGGGNSDGRSGDGLKKGDYVNIGVGPTFIGRIDVQNYTKHNPGYFSKPHHGLRIELPYKDNNSGFKFFEWIQTVAATEDTPEIEVFADPKDGRDRGQWPYYYNEADFKDPFYDPPRGYDDYFIDDPSRTDKGFIQSFKAEVTLLGVDKNNKLVPLITFNYGFILMPGAHDVSLIPLTVVSMYPNGYSNLSLTHSLNISFAKPRN